MGATAVALLAGALVIMPQKVERKVCTAPDGVRIVYSAAGAGDTALVFVHGGMADRRFYDGEFEAFSAGYRVIAIDLAGHGESGDNRTAWGIPQFGADVKAVADAEGLRRMVLFGNSLGGPVVVEASMLMPGRVIGVVGIDTFQDLAGPRTPERAREQAEALRTRALAFREDYRGAMKMMVKALFHADADPALVSRTEQRMLKTNPQVAYEMLLSLAGYDFVEAARRLTVPLRVINGDLFPTDVAAIRKVKPDFDAIVMKHTGHYPMIERPEEFTRHVTAILTDLRQQGPRR